jgi:hypothetical protein
MPRPSGKDFLQDATTTPTITLYPPDIGEKIGQIALPPGAAVVGAM